MKWASRYDGYNRFHRMKRQDKKIVQWHVYACIEAEAYGKVSGWDCFDYISHPRRLLPPASPSLLSLESPRRHWEEMRSVVGLILLNFAHFNYEIFGAVC